MARGGLVLGENVENEGRTVLTWKASTEERHVAGRVAAVCR